MIRAVGYEGSRHSESPVNWGTAALSDGEYLINAATGQRTRLGELDQLVAEGHITRLFREVKVPDQFDGSPLVVAEIRRTDPTFPSLAADTGKAGGLAAHAHNEKQQVYLFENQNAFDAYCKRATTALLNTLLYEKRTPTQQRHLLQVGLVLASNDVALNAVKVALTQGDRRARAKNIAMARIRQDEKQSFLDLLDALTTDKPEYVIKYKDGITKGGGLNLSDAAKIVSNANATHEPFVGQLAKIYPFLRPPPPPRLRDLKGAASAHFHFVANIEGAPLGERVARLLELKMLEQSLAGELPPNLDIIERARVERAVEYIRAPAEGTIVSHVRIEGDEQQLEGDDSERRAGRTRRSQPFVMLGYQVGLIKQADEVEITLAPPSGKRKGLMLRTSDDGDGQQPRGVRPLQEGSALLLRPALYTIIRVIHPDGRETTHLREVRALEVGESRKITAIPSSVVDGAILWDFELAVKRTSANDLRCDLGRLSGLDDATIRGAREWIEAFAELTAQFELDPAARFRNIKCWKPSKAPTPTALQRIVVALHELKGAAHQSKVVGLIDARFGGNVRLNNTRREVLANPTVLAFDEKNPRVLRLLPDGEKLVRAFLRAGGQRFIVS